MAQVDPPKEFFGDCLQRLANKVFNNKKGVDCSAAAIQEKLSITWAQGRELKNGRGGDRRNLYGERTIRDWLRNERALTLNDREYFDLISDALNLNDDARKELKASLILWHETPKNEIPKRDRLSRTVAKSNHGTPRKNVICLLIPREEGSSFWSAFEEEFVKDFKDDVEFNEFTVASLHHQENILLEISHLKFLQDFKELAGVVIAYACGERERDYEKIGGVEEYISDLLGKNVPIVSIDRKFVSSAIKSLSLDGELQVDEIEEVVHGKRLLYLGPNNVTLGEACTNELIKIKPHTIVGLFDHEYINPSEDRSLCFNNVMKRNEEIKAVIKKGDQTSVDKDFRGFFDRSKEILDILFPGDAKGSTKGKAVLCVNSFATEALFRSIEERQKRIKHAIKVPDMLSIICCDDSPRLSNLPINITTSSYSPHRLAERSKRAIKLLIGRGVTLNSLNSLRYDYERINPRGSIKYK